MLEILRHAAPTEFAVALKIKFQNNAEMITNLRREWRRVQRRRPGEVSLHHVRSHVNVPGNELADWLAGCGTITTNSVTLRNATTWMRDWMQRNGESPDMRDENAQTPGSRRPNINILGDPRGVG